VIKVHADPLRLKVERLQCIEDFESIAREWDALDASTRPRTPFTSRLWNTLWWKHFRRDKLVVRDEFHSYVIRDQRGELLAIAPMMLTLRPAVGPLQSRELQFFGGDPNVTEIRGLVCRPEHSLPATSALLDMLSHEGMEWSWAYICGVRNIQQDAQQQTVSLEWTRHVPCYFLHIGGSWHEFKSRLPRNIKQSLRKCYNSLKRDGVAFLFEVACSVENCDQALSEFFRLHAERAAFDGASIRHPDVFSSRQSRDFLREYAAALARMGNLRMFRISIEGKVVAVRMGFQLGNEVYLYYSGYDTHWRKYSIMTTVLAEAIQWCISRGITIVNLSTGTDESKMRWRPDRSMHSEAVVQASGLKARLAFIASRVALRRIRASAAE
jgi:CelD/BcsL family acetyltransferase involved in cellulose biosynthesis